MSSTNVTRSTPTFKNEAHISGTLAKGPSVRYTPSGKAVANLTILTKYEQYSEYHKVVAWEKLAEKVEKLAKGDFVKAVGRLQTRSWDDKQTGQKKYITEIVAFQIVLPGEEPAPLTPDMSKSGTTTARALLRPAEKNAHGLEVSDADVPF